MSSKRNDPQFKARIERLSLEQERQAAIKAAKIVALQAYHNLQTRLTQIGHSLHEEGWQTASDKLAIFQSDANLDANAVKWACDRANQLQKGY